MVGGNTAKVIFDDINWIAEAAGFICGNAAVPTCIRHGKAPLSIAQLSGDLN